MHSTEGLLTVSEVAEMLRVDDSTVRRWIASRDLAAIQLPGKTFRIPASAIEALLKPLQQRSSRSDDGSAA